MKHFLAVEIIIIIINVIPYLIYQMFYKYVVLGNIKTQSNSRVWSHILLIYEYLHQ